MNNKKKLGMIREYRKTLKTMRKDGAVPDSLKMHNNQQSVRPKKGKMSIFKRALVEYQEKQSEKEKKKEAKELARKEREEALKKYKKKKNEHYRLLAKKTKWGQPVMKNRVQILLEKLQEQMNQT